MEARGFLQGLFDFSFSTFITTKIVKVVYGFCVLGAAGVSILVAKAAGEVLQDEAALVPWLFAPLVFLIQVVFARMILESVVVFFRIAEYARDIAAMGLDHGLDEDDDEFDEDEFDDDDED